MVKVKKIARRIYLAVKDVVVPPRVVWPTFHNAVKKSIAVAAMCAAVAAVTAVMDAGIAGILNIPLMF